MSFTYCECVFVSVGIHYAMGMPSVACPALLYFFPPYRIKGTIFEKKSYGIQNVC